MIAAVTNQLWWYAARSGGFVAWGLLSASVIWGLMLSGKLRPGQVRPNWILDLHRFLGGLAAVFTGIHVLTIMADSYTDIGVADVLVPFTSSWKPGAVAWGIVGMYLLAAVELTSLLKKHLPKKLWQRVHVLSLPLFALATIHLLQAGTDASNVVVYWIVGIATVVVAGLTAWRVGTRNRTPTPRRTPRPAAPAAAPRAAAPGATAPTPAPVSPTTSPWASPVAPPTTPPWAPPAAPPATSPWAHDDHLTGSHH